MENNYLTPTPRFRYWWMPLITGILSIGVGVCCFIFPAASMSTLAIFFMCVLLVAGIFNICYAIGNHGHNSHWGWSLANGLIELVLGIWLWTFPLGELTEVFIYAVAFWVLFMVIYGIAETTSLYSYRVGWIGWLIGFIFIALVCVLIFLMGPIGNGIFAWVFIGCSFEAYGIWKIVMSFRLKKYNDRH